MVLRLEDIHLRDPFVLPEVESGWYFLYGTTDSNCWGPVGTGFDAFRSRDLKTWEGPFEVFRPKPGFWGSHHFWAPEVHRYRGSCYMLASFKGESRARGTQILVSEGALGPFRPHSDGPVTPADWECLDGTLHWEDAAHPWMVFCHEWTQIGDGTVAAIPLRTDLIAASGEPVVLFHGSAAAWTTGTAESPGARVTDGPWLHRHCSGALLMLWSSLHEDGYALGVARSRSGKLLGPWTHDAAPLFSGDGGHGMLFRDFEGGLRLAIHQPNQQPNERPRFFTIEETAEGLSLRPD